MEEIGLAWISLGTGGRRNHPKNQQGPEGKKPSDAVHVVMNHRRSPKVILFQVNYLPFIIDASFAAGQRIRDIRCGGPEVDGSLKLTGRIKNFRKRESILNDFPEEFQNGIIPV
jgi:hypothetical protein